MKGWLTIILMLVSNTGHAGIYEFLFGNDNFYECLLYEMPDAEDDMQAKNLYRECKQDYPLSIPLQRKESYLDMDSATQCIAEQVEKTDSALARTWIKQACYKVYLRK